MPETIDVENPNTPYGEKYVKEDFGPVVYLKKYPDQSVATNIPHYWDFHSPSHRYNFNCNCRGALNLALNILLHAGYDRIAAFALHRFFAKDFLNESLPRDWLMIRISRVREWGDHQIKALKLQVEKEFHL